MPESRMDTGFQGFRKVLEFGIMFGWPIQRSDSGGCGTRTRSVDFVRYPRCAVSSVIRRRASSLLCGAQKNGLRLLWSSSLGLVRPAHAPGSRSVLRRHAHLPGVRGAACAVPELWHSEARAARRSWPTTLSIPSALPIYVGRRCRQATIKDVAAGVASGLAYGQGTGQAVHARAAAPKRARPDPRPSASTRSRSARVTPIASW